MFNIHLLKNASNQVWSKLTWWFWTRRLCISNLVCSFPLEEGHTPFLKNSLCQVLLKLDQYFYAPWDRRSGGILFLSCLSFCHSVILSFRHSPWNFNLANNFLTVVARALIYHMSIPCDKTFPWVPLFFTMWPWPWSLTHFKKTLTLLITFEQWVLELWYFTWVSLVIKPFRGYHYFFTLWPWPESLTYFFKP